MTDVVSKASGAGSAGYDEWLGAGQQLLNSGLKDKSALAFIISGLIQPGSLAPVKGLIAALGNPPPKEALDRYCSHGLAISPADLDLYAMKAGSMITAGQEKGDDTADLIRCARVLLPDDSEVLSWHVRAENSAGKDISLLIRASEIVDPDDRFGVTRHVRDGGKGLTNEYVETLFDRYAETYDDHLSGHLHYQGPDLIKKAIMTNAPNERFSYAADLGCGTGLVGHAIGPMCEALVGVDLSEQMLVRAARTGLYTALYQQDAMGWLKDNRDLDLLVAGEMVPYLEDPAPLLENAQPCLKPGGLFVFSIRTGTDHPSEMTEYDVFAHNPNVVKALAEKQGWNVREMISGTIHTAGTHDVATVIITLQKSES